MSGTPRRKVDLAISFHCLVVFLQAVFRVCIESKYVYLWRCVSVAVVSSATVEWCGCAMIFRLFWCVLAGANCE